jgi:hypothetical protein
MEERMVINLAGSPTVGGHGRVPLRLNPPFWYAMYGMHVRSDLVLPVAPGRQGSEGADLLFRRAVGKAPAPLGLLVHETRCDCAKHGGAVVSRVLRSHLGTWICHESIAIFVVSSDARRVDVYPEDGADEREIGLLLAGEVTTYILHRRGHPCLHASAITTAYGAVAFVGPHGRGKSTMAASFLRHGGTLLADDTLAFEARSGGVYGLPALPMLKVWPETAMHTLRLDEELPGVDATNVKKLFALAGRYPFATQPALLRALYLLERYDPVATGRTDVGIRSVNPRDGVAALLSQTSFAAMLQPVETMALLPVYARLAVQAPVRVLTCPNGFEYQDAVHAAIMADIAGGHR